MYLSKPKLELKADKDSSELPLESQFSSIVTTTYHTIFNITLPKVEDGKDRAKVQR